MSEIEPVALVGTCKSCLAWDEYNPSWGTCKRTQWEDGKTNPLYNDSCMRVDAGAIYGYEIVMKELDTPSNFACNQWEAKE